MPAGLEPLGDTTLTSKLAMIIPGRFTIRVINAIHTQWCLDWFAEEAYKLSFDEHPLGPNTGEFRVIRGACFMDRELFMRSSQRGYLAPDMVVNNQGFRVMCEE